MGSADEIQVMPGQEIEDTVRSKRIRHPSIILAPAFDFFVRVSPQQVTEEASVWHIGRPGYPLDLLQ